MKSPTKVKLAGACLLTTTVMLSSCMVGPDYQRPEVRVPDTWSAELNKDFSKATPQLAGWWSVFNDSTLNKLIDDAGRDNLDLKIAVTRIEEARALRGATTSALYPTVQGFGSATAFRNSSESSVGGGDDRQLYDLGVGAGWELDVWGRVRRSVEASDAELLASEEDYRDTLVLLYSEIASNYINLRSIQQRISYAEDNIETQRETLKLTENRKETGLAPDLDVRQAELNLASTEAALPVLRSALMQSIHRLGVLSGKSPNSLAASLKTRKSIPNASKKASMGIPADIMRQRPDIRAAERRLAAQTALIGVKEAELYPTFTLPGTISLQALDGGNLGSGLTYGIGPQFTWNLFTGGRVRAEIYAEEVRAERAELTYKNTVLGGLEDVENALVEIREQSKRVLALKRAVVAAEASVEQVKTLYTTGLTNFQNVLDMERSLTVQQDELAQSQGAVSIAHVQLYRAMGGGWQSNAQK
ncbi:efflux transporter outer membrane subunit [Persicirhabdus sediminis]|uniref:Efflux transporter outer membrane subunit n=1 Tax=Persicirhabdus sediminis TaxID=454144 RepID=A0A8J7MB20_9BACT|nr:efflux transporter outer membrane subunit [Persicirhabdus sediminis]MBK1789822.1 efflux transporter outer membrane subunit [Persicirhabdus sediminis]